jgi:hypothetical protein
MSARLAAEFRAGLDDARQAFRLSLQNGEEGDAVELAVGGSFLWRNAMGCTEGDAWIDDLQRMQLSARDHLWVCILRADVGQGRGDHRQMFDAAERASRAVEGADDAAAAGIVAHYRALAHLTEPDAEAYVDRALELAGQSGDVRLVTLMGAFRAVSDIAGGRHERARAAVAQLDRSASMNGYDRFILHWTGWMLALAERDADAAREWMGNQQSFLDRTGIVETWLTSLSSAMCDVIDGHDAAPLLARALALAEREGYRADADCVLVLAYAEMCANHMQKAAALIGSAVRGRFNTTAHHVLYRAVLDPMLRQNLDDAAIRDGMARGAGWPAAGKSTSNRGANI